MTIFSTRNVVSVVLLALAACSRGGDNAKDAMAATVSGSGARASGGNDWISNGATACEKYVTPDFAGQIFTNPAGHSKKLSAQACSFATPDFVSISITLAAGGLTAFEAHQKYLSNPVPLSGVGDKAVRTDTGIEAVKGSNRMCAIDVMPPFGNKLKGEPLAEKLGELCNRLFALP